MRLRLGDRELEVEPTRPLVMGVVNASPDSFSDAGEGASHEAVVRRGIELAAAGAAILDVGGESARTDTPVVPEREEIERVVPPVRELAARGLIVSVDTWKPRVAAAALDAGAVMVNDVSGLRDPEVATVCADRGAGLVVMHTRAAPKRFARPDYPDVVADVATMLRERVAAARALGVEEERIVVDPGPDFAKTPAQTVAVLRRLGALADIGRPVLLAVSRKDFVGALTGRAPRERLAGTLAAVGAGLDAGASLLRVHDVAEVCDFLRVRAALRGETELPPDLALDDALRREGGGGGGAL